MRTATLLAILLTASAALAQPAAPSRSPAPTPPTMMVKIGKASQPLGVRALVVDARILGHLAETTMTMTFHNPHSRALAGDLYFPLPAGSTISGYALDIGGVMVPGVVVAKDVARQVFEKEVRKGIDPGLVEWVSGSNFKTRVFPIPAGGTRTVRVSYVSEVGERSDGGRYVLPLAFRRRLGQMSVKVEVIKSAKAPIVVEGGPAGLTFQRKSESFLAEMTARDVQPDKDLVVRIPMPPGDRVLVERASDGRIYYALRTRVKPPSAVSGPSNPKRIQVIWDASGSRATADHARELGLLRRYLKGRHASVDLVVVRNGHKRVGSFRLPNGLDSLIGRIKGLGYDGGTQLGTFARDLGKAELALLFTDGISNFGREAPSKVGAPLFVVNSHSTANHAALRALATANGGAYLDLGRLTDAAADAAIGKPVWGFTGATIGGRPAGSVFPFLPRPVHGTFDAAGRLKAGEATLQLTFGGRAWDSLQRTITVSADGAARGDLLRRYWAQKKLDDLLVRPKRNKKAIIALGTAFSIVTPGTSLIVLERLEQYVEHRIRPPKVLGKMVAAYDSRIAALGDQAKRVEKDRLEAVLALWKARVAWWKKTYEYPADFKFGGRKQKKSGRPAPSAARDSDADGLADDRSEEVRGKDSKKKAAGANGGPSISIRPWDPKTPYLAALKAAAAGDRVSTYMAQRAEFGTSPAFFMDCAEFFLRKKDRAMAVRVLSNIAELELENPALIRILAHRLAQMDELSLAIQLFERARELRPEEPQSHRDLALVLARRAERATKRGDRSTAVRDFNRAMDLLAQVVMGKWDRFAEIELMALTELNNILPKARKVGIRREPVDARLIQPLDMDVRIVMTWDADLTDMDLHVVEPSEEEAYYSHNRTTIGGMVSRDFTRGYGPEVYALRRAMKGKYTIRTKYYGSSSAKLAGAVTLQVDVYTNYGRHNEKRRSLTLRLTERKEMFTVGDISF